MNPAATAGGGAAAAADDFWGNLFVLRECARATPRPPRVLALWSPYFSQQPFAPTVRTHTPLASSSCRVSSHTFPSFLLSPDRAADAESAGTPSSSTPPSPVHGSAQPLPATSLFDMLDFGAGGSTASVVQPAAALEAAGAFGGAAGTNPLFAGLEPGPAALAAPVAEGEAAAVEALLDAMPKLGRYLMAQSVA